jgi:hypothetical protein
MPTIRGETIFKCFPAKGCNGSSHRQRFLHVYGNPSFVANSWPSVAISMNGGRRKEGSAGKK